MIYVLSAVAIVLLALPGVAHRWGRRLHPVDWSAWCYRSLLGGAAAAETAVALIAVPSVLDAVGMHGLAAVCAQMAGVASLPGAWLGWLAAGSAMVGPAMAWWTRRVARRADREIACAALLSPILRLDGTDIRVLPLDRPLAVSLRANGGLIVISSALTSTLSTPQLSAVVRHERAHLKYRHHRQLIVAAWIESVLGVFPPTRRSTQVLRTAVERAADEEAAHGGGGRRGEVRSALLAVVLADTPVGIAAFSSTHTIVERIRSLDDPAPNRDRRWWAGIPILSMTGVGGAAGAIAVVQVGTAILMYFNCPFL